MEYVIGILLLVSFVGLGRLRSSRRQPDDGYADHGYYLDSASTDWKYFCDKSGIYRLLIRESRTSVLLMRSRKCSSPVRKAGEVFLSMLCLVHGLVVYCFRQVLQMH